MKNKSITFADFPASRLNELTCDVAIIGLQYGTPYCLGELSPSHHAPAAIRKESMRYPEDVFSWDFDLSGTLLSDSNLKIQDCGDLPGDENNPSENRRKGENAIRTILDKGAIPIVLGGDDSIPSMVFRAYEDHGPINILQIDAHIDWRHEVGGITEGFSSPMRRAAEMSWVDKIIQVGARGTGTARKEEYDDALAYGAKIVSAYDLHQKGVDHLLDLIPAEIPCFLTIDCDGLDPAVMPGVMSPAPGGLTYHQMLDIIRGIQRKTNLAGLILVEYVPEKDVNNVGAVTAMRIIWNFIGVLARSGLPKH